MMCAVPELIVLQRSDESSSEFSRLSAEEKLLRWVNYHLSNNGCREQAIGLGTDLQDGRLLIYLLNKMYPEKCDLSGLNFDSDYDRVSKVIPQTKYLIFIEQYSSTCFFPPCKYALSHNSLWANQVSSQEAHLRSQT